MQLSNNAKIGAAVGCLLVAGVILYFTTFNDMVGSGGSEKMVMLCTNPKCEKAFKIPYEEYAKIWQLQGGNPMTMMSPKPIKCKFCNQITALTATECPKCKNVFIEPMEQRSIEYPDRCPECKFSQMEEDDKNSK